jgi:Tfx family DNA-binding protein
MKDGLLTERQKDVLRYRKRGLTQQQIADIFNTSKANICTIEKSAMENIRRAKETLEFLYTLDARHLCTLKAGTDLFEAGPLIYAEAGKFNIKVNCDSIELINRLRVENPKRIRGRHIREDIEVYLSDDGELYFG